MKVADLVASLMVNGTSTPLSVLRLTNECSLMLFQPHPSAKVTDVGSIVAVTSSPAAASVTVRLNVAAPSGRIVLPMVYLVAGASLAKTKSMTTKGWSPLPWKVNASQLSTSYSYTEG